MSSPQVHVFEPFQLLPSQRLLLGAAAWSASAS